MSDALARLFALEAFGIKLGLASMRTLVAALGHPERRYPTVHVAGTNGKGSVCAIVERALRAAGLRTGLYTSPHLARIEERAAVNGAPVPAADFASAARDVLATVDAVRAVGRLEVTPTFFEVTTAIAFELFARAGVDVAVIEVGLGGRYDATNVITPVAGAITSIAMDHERHLGTTIAAIATEKAGIAKPGVPLVVGAVPVEAMAVIRDVAARAGAPVMVAGDAVTPVSMEQGIAVVRLQADGEDGPAIRLSLAGRHQVGNAATAVRLIEMLRERGLRVSRDAIVSGLTGAHWPARLEWLRVGEGRLLVDAAHNPAGAAALASYLREAEAAPLPLVLAAMQDKDLAGMMAALRPVVSRVVATEVEGARAWRATDLAERVEALAPGLPVEAIRDADAAVTRGLAESGRAVVAGSIYLVGPLRARLLAAGATAI